MKNRTIESGKERSVGMTMSKKAIHVFVFPQNGSELDLQWIENGFETLEFFVEDDLPFPLTLSSPSK